MSTDAPPRPPPTSGSPGDDLAALVSGCAARDPEALHRLYRSQAARLQGLAVRITGDAAVAEDVLHDVFLAVWHDSARFDPGDGSVQAWLTTLTRFRAMDAVRPPAASARAAPAADAALNGRFARLDPRAKTALVAAFVDGLTAREIADVQQVPLETLVSLVRRSLGDLAEHA